jgi:sugar/nucleoside kinase (ribokinase family)
MNSRAVALGAHVLDILARPVTHIPEGQGAALVEQVRFAPAGSAAGTAVGMAKLGLSVASVGALGDDVSGALLLRMLDQYGVDTSYAVRKQGVPTSTSILPIRPNGDRPALHLPGATLEFSVDDVPWTLLETAKYLHLGGNDVMRGLGRDGAVVILKHARAWGAVTTMDMLGEGSARMLAIMAPALPFVDWFMPNLEQACRLTGTESAEEAARQLLDKGVARGVVLKMGAEGSLMMTASETVRLPAHTIDVVDTSGCGDAYCAGFIRGLSLGWTPAESMRLGTAAGALVAQGLGSDAGIEDLEQTLHFMNTTPLQGTD